MANRFNPFDYNKEGPGIDKDAPPKKRFFLFWELVFRKILKLMLLNILYVVCCIPVVTFGAATAALTYVLRNMAQEKPVFVVSDFFDAFRKNWKRATVVGLLQLVLTVILVISLLFYWGLTGTEGMFMVGMLAFIFCCAVGLLFIFTTYYIYLMIVTCDLPLKKAIKNSFILAVVGLKTNLITTIGIAAEIAIIVFLVPLVLWPFLLFLLSFAFAQFLVVFNSYQYITKYVTDPFYEAQREAGLLPEEEDNEEEAIFKDRGSMSAEDEE